MRDSLRFPIAFGAGLVVGVVAYALTRSYAAEFVSAFGVSFLLGRYLP